MAKPVPRHCPPYVLCWASQSPIYRLPRGMLACNCWCERFTVAVTEADVLNGRTKTCGRPDCEPPDLSLLGVA